MNAFRRGHAITGLEEISMVICMHLVLVSSFPENEAANHWNVEIGGFLKTLKRWDKGKKGVHNYSFDIVASTLTEILEDDDQQELIEGHVESKGLNPEKIDWKASVDAAKAFATHFKHNEG